MNTDLSQESQSQDMSLVRKIVGIFTDPSATFQAIRINPGWVAPFIILMIFTFGMFLVIKPIIVAEQTAKLETQLQERGMDDDQIEKAIEQSQKIMNYTMYAGTILAPIIVLLILAGIWLFVGNTILGGQASFKHMLAVSAYISLIPIVGSLIKLPIILSKQTINVHFSLATFMSDSAKDTFLYKVLVNTDLFNIWSIVLLCLGIAIVAGLKVKKVWPVVVSLYVVWYLATAGLGKLLGA